MVPARIKALFRRQRIRDLTALADFVRTQAAQVAQVSILGYLRARMGTQWPTYFEDPAFAPEIERATRDGFRICAADLAVFAAAELGVGPDVARWIFAAVVEEAPSELPAPQDKDFSNSDSAFDTSIETLIDTIPVIADFRDQDREGFENALRLRWSEVRRQFRKSVDRTALAATVRDLNV